METQGAKLKKIRLEKGISLEEVQKKTKIHLNILKAIEGDSLTDLSPVYLKGFLKIYCKFFSLNPQDYIAEYKKPKPAEAAIALLNAPKAGLPSFKNIDKRVKSAFVLVLAVIILSYGLFNLGKFFVSKSRPRAGKSRPSSKITKQIPGPKEAQLSASLKKDEARGIRLGIRAKDHCWVSLKIDGRVVFQRVLEKGRFESWQAKEKIELSLGNAAGVELEVNGQLFSNLGRRGQAIKNIIITREGLNITR